MKQGHLEIRPVYLRREDRTKAYVFVTMMAFMIEKTSRILGEHKNFCDGGIKS